MKNAMENDIKSTDKKECLSCHSRDVVPTGSGYGQTKIVELGGKTPQVTNFRFVCNN